MTICLCHSLLLQQQYRNALCRNETCKCWKICCYWNNNQTLCLKMCKFVILGALLHLAGSHHISILNPAELAEVEELVPLPVALKLIYPEIGSINTPESNRIFKRLKVLRRKRLLLPETEFVRNKKKLVPVQQSTPLAGKDKDGEGPEHRNVSSSGRFLKNRTVEIGKVNGENLTRLVPPSSEYFPVEASLTTPVTLAKDTATTTSITLPSTESESSTVVGVPELVNVIVTDSSSQQDPNSHTGLAEVVTETLDISYTIPIQSGNQSETPIEVTTFHPNLSNNQLSLDIEQENGTQQQDRTPRRLHIMKIQKLFNDKIEQWSQHINTDGDTSSIKEEKAGGSISENNGNVIKQDDSRNNSSIGGSGEKSELLDRSETVVPVLENSSTTNSSLTLKESKPALTQEVSITPDIINPSDEKVEEEVFEQQDTLDSHDNQEELLAVMRREIRSAVRLALCQAMPGLLSFCAPIPSCLPNDARSCNFKHNETDTTQVAVGHLENSNKENPEELLHNKQEPRRLPDSRILRAGKKHSYNVPNNPRTQSHSNLIVPATPVDENPWIPMTPHTPVRGTENKAATLSISPQNAVMASRPYANGPTPLANSAYPIADQGFYAPPPQYFHPQQWPQYPQYSQYGFYQPFPFPG